MRKAAGSLGTDPPDAAAAIALTSESPGEAAAEHAGEPRASSVRKAAGRSAAHPLGRGSETAALAEGGRPSKPRPNPSGSRCEEAGGTDAPTAVGGNSARSGEHARTQSEPPVAGATRAHHEAARDASPLPPTAPPPSPAAPPPSLALLPPAPAPAPRRRSPTPPPLPPLRRASSVRKAAGSASPLPKDDGGSANDGSADRAGGEAWVCSPGSCAPGSAPGGVGVAGCTPPCVYGSDAAASTGVLPRPEIPSIALSEVERESSSLCSLVVRASPPQPSSVWEASCAASDATRRGVSASPPPPSETAAAHASGPSSEAGATSSPALGAASPKAACAVNGEGASVGAGVGTAAGAAATALPPRPGGSESRAPRPSASARSRAEGRGGDLARGVALAGIGIAADAGLRGGIGGGALDAVDRRVDRGRARNTGPRLGAAGSSGPPLLFTRSSLLLGVLRRRPSIACLGRPALGRGRPCRAAVDYARPALLRGIARRRWRGSCRARSASVSKSAPAGWPLGAVGATVAALRGFGSAPARRE